MATAVAVTCAEGRALPDGLIVPVAPIVLVGAMLDNAGSGVPLAVEVGWLITQLRVTVELGVGVV
ncbi:hypothetical protein HII36_02720 [Nonomuraea sp. NN258]|uniref:hypothetical protein n=1 Tax=Nonomuraea antri TaxID=2730852 RepID=UPI00156A2F00|nr:hypothetical protein [Nonomuraea antri]NRQ30752.1 hypothetical protein [Nonomuraea antri]